MSSGETGDPQVQSSGISVPAGAMGELRATVAAMEFDSQLSALRLYARRIRSGGLIGGALVKEASDSACRTLIKNLRCE